MHRHRRLLFFLPLLAALALVFASCGGSTHQPQTAAGSVHPPGWGKPAPVSAQLFALQPRTGVTATMYDTITLSTVPDNPFALAGYTAGFWPTFLPLRHAYPNAHTISIAIAAGYHADCLDVEPGDATPAQVVGWVRIEIRLGWPKPCIYSSWWMFRNEVNPALARAGIHQWQVWKWDADYTYHPHIDLGFDATQWTDRAFGSNLDESLVTRAFLSIAHPPFVNLPPGPTPAERKARVLRETRHLHSLYHERVKIRRHLLNSHCRVKHPRRACRPLFRRGDAVNHEIGVLRARGVR